MLCGAGSSGVASGITYNLLTLSAGGTTLFEVRSVTLLACSRDWRIAYVQSYWHACESSLVLFCVWQVTGSGRTTVTQSGLVVGAGGGTVTAGGLAVDAGGVLVSAGGVTVVNGGTKVQSGGLFVDDNGATIASTVTAGSPTLTKIQQTSSSFATGTVMAVEVGGQSVQPVPRSRCSVGRQRFCSCLSRCRQPMPSPCQRITS